jgi:prepilin-type N-terminal cleavage/methylation domain-containing protein
MKKSRTAGFTLIELLVVIAIIAVLAGILFPVFAAVQRKARMAADATNLHQIAMALKQYELDSKYPPPYLLDPTGTITIDPNGKYIARGDIQARDDPTRKFSYQDDGYGNTLYNFTGLMASGFAEPPATYYLPAKANFWPPATGNAGAWESYGIRNWREFPMMANKQRPQFTIVTWSPYNCRPAGGYAYSIGPIILLRADGSVKIYAESQAVRMFAPDPATNLAPFQHQTVR